MIHVGCRSFPRIMKEKFPSSLIFLVINDCIAISIPSIVTGSLKAEIAVSVKLLFPAVICCGNRNVGFLSSRDLRENNAAIALSVLLSDVSNREDLAIPSRHL